ncbi:hypothetical protein EK904_011946 [Melospiza melodia maxima]|nr:hypothetical protein EK904_011946 [Melospiza melodia maxima]
MFDSILPVKVVVPTSKREIISRSALLTAIWAQTPALESHILLSTHFATSHSETALCKVLKNE